MTSIEHGNVQLVEKVNSVFLGTRDFKVLAEKAVELMATELKSAGILSASIFRVRPEEDRLYAYAFSSRAVEAINKLYPKKFSELSAPLTESSNLLVKAVQTKQEQESNSLHDFARPILNAKVSAAIQRLVGAKHGIAYPLRLKNGKVAGVLLFSIGEESFTDQQRVLLEAFRAQFELAFENVVEFERVVERYKQKAARTADEDKPTVHFMLRITPKQNAYLEQAARAVKLDKTSFIRSWIDGELKSQ